MSAVASTPGGTPAARSERPPPGPGLQPSWGGAQRQQAIAEVLGGLARAGRAPCARWAPGGCPSAWRHAVACGRIWSSGTPMCAGTCRCTGPTLPMCGCSRLEPGQDTDWHDHGGSSGSFAITEELLAKSSTVPRAQADRPQAVFASEAVVGAARVHDVAHGGGAGRRRASMRTIAAADGDDVLRRHRVRLDRQGNCAVDGPEGARGRGDPPAPRYTDRLGIGRQADLRRAAADASMTSCWPRPAADLAQAPSGGGVRGPDRRRRAGRYPAPGAADRRGRFRGRRIGRNVLEWRLDPRSEARIPALARADAQIIVMCSEGYASTLAAATLRRIGLRQADRPGRRLPRRGRRPGPANAPGPAVRLMRAAGSDPTEPGALTGDRCQDALGPPRPGRRICRHLPAYLPRDGLVPRKHGTASASQAVAADGPSVCRAPHDRQGRSYRGARADGTRIARHGPRLGLRPGSGGQEVPGRPGRAARVWRVAPRR